MQVIFITIVFSLLNFVNSQQSYCQIVAPNSNTFAGSPTPYKTVATCIKEYLDILTKINGTSNTTFIYGFDFNNQDSSCWFSTSATVRSAVGIDHYNCTLLPLIAPGTCSYYVTNYNTNGGLVQPLANTLDNCKTACLVNPICTYGFDWVVAGTDGAKCYLSTNLAIKQATGVTHYYCIAALTTAPAPLTVPVGVLRCQIFVSSNSPGGTLAPSSVNTPDKCKSACYFVNNCIFGFDFNNGDNTCWLSTSQTVNTGAIGVDHYTCVSSTSAYNSANCNWSPIQNTNTPGGVAQSTLITLNQCMSGCQASATCQTNGFDWNPTNSPSCWFSTSTSLQAASGVTHYVCQGGSAVVSTAAPTVTANLCQWLNKTGYSSPGGTQLTNATTLSACMTICQASTICLLYGFDWNPANAVGAQCFISNSVALVNNTGIIHYTWNCGGCTLVQYPNTNSPGGKLDNAITIQECQTNCLKSPTCWQYGFDWDGTNVFKEYCWLSNSTATAPAANISHYLPICSPTGNATTPSSTGSNCIWNLAVDQHTIGGTLVPTAVTLQQCQDACKNSTTCNTFGMDWDVTQAPGGQCYISTSSALVPLKNVAHYTYICLATSPTATPSSLTCSWVAQTNLQTIGGLQNNASTLAECQARCLQIPTCSLNGVDFVPAAAAGSRCWISTNNVTYSTIGVNHYAYQCTCSDPVCTNNKNSPGGLLISSASTEAECKSACLQYPSQCIPFGYDWAINGNVGSQCWLSTSNASTNLTGVKHCSFSASGCSNTGITVATCSWSNKTNQNSPGGVYNSASTLEACQSACLSSTSCTQYGFDWTPDKICWLSINPTLATFTGVTHYTYSCQSTGPQTTVPNCAWTTSSDTNSPGGILQSSLTTLASCQAGCAAATSTCAKYGFDFDLSQSVGRQCWYSTSDGRGTLTGCSHYTYSCTGLTNIPITVPGASCQWQELLDINSPGGTLVVSATDVASCQSACIKSLTQCAQFGLDFNYQTNTCYLSTSTITSNTNDKDMISHFNYVCSSGCTWKTVSNSNSPGGVLQKNVLTLGQCQSLCIQLGATICPYGFDWDAMAPLGGQCWFSTTATLASFSGVTHYICQSSSSTAPPVTTVCGWNVFVGKLLSSPVGDPKPTITTQANCQNTCAGTFSCKAYGWRPVNVAPTAKCFFFYVNTLPDSNTDATSIHSIYFC